jgi:hypothetical protein
MNKLMNEFQKKKKQQQQQQQQQQQEKNTCILNLSFLNFILFCFECIISL